MLNTEIYSWTKKKYSSKPGLIDVIGTEDSPLNLENEKAHKLWHIKCAVENIELFMDVGKIYIQYHSIRFSLKFGIWIKIPNDKSKYINNLGKRKRNDDAEVEYNLLLPRTLHELYDLSERDHYIQLGDLSFCEEAANSNHRNHPNNGNLSHRYKNKKPRK